MIQDAYYYIINAINDNQFAQGGFVIAALTWVWYQLRTLPLLIYSWIRKFIIFECTITLENDSRTYEAFNKWYNFKYPHKFRKIGVKFEKPYNSELNEYGDYESVLYQETDYNYIYHSYRLLTIQKLKEKVQNALSASDLYNHEYKISGFFARKAILNLIENIKNDLIIDDRKKDGIRINTSNNKFSDDVKYLKVYKNFNNLYFEGKDKFISDLYNHINRRDLLKKHGIKHKLGIKLYGPPGTGKTSIAIAIADEFRMNINLINLNNFANDREFVKFCMGAQPNSIFLFEDIDEYLGTSKRSNTKSESRVSFTSILQFMDGVLSPENVIIIFTTNTPNELDPALYRDGRINIKLHVDYPKHDNIIGFLTNFYNVSITPILDMGPKSITMSTVEKLCLDSDDIYMAIDKIKKCTYESD